MESELLSYTKETLPSEWKGFIMLSLNSLSTDDRPPRVLVTEVHHTSFADFYAFQSPFFVKQKT